MKIKLTRAQLEGLYLLITTGLENTAPEGVAAKLMYVLVDKLNERIRTKLRKLDNGSTCGYSLSLNEVEAMAFYCWYRNVCEELVGLQYERLVAQQCVNEIDREYA